jgi:Ca2+-binding RTX toxin-like protein
VASAATAAVTNVISGTSGAELLLGTGHADTIFGFDGNDIIKGFQGNDFIDGGTGRDVSDYSDATGSISVDLASGVVTGDASVGIDTLRSIEYIRGTNFNDVYVATGFNRTSPNNSLDIPIISSVNNTFEGGGGNDTITGSAGTQVSYSTGFGGTQISYAHASDAVTVDLLAGTAQGTAPNDIANVGTDTFTGVNAIMGSDYNDTLLGTNSLLHVDVFYGGKGDDFIDGRAGYDFVTYTNFLDPSVITAGITINMAAGTVTGNSSIGVDTLRSVELIRGTQFNDVYNATNFGVVGFLNTSTNNVGNFGTYNQFEGMGGNDTITGNGNTRVDYNFALAAVTVDLAEGTGHSTVADNADVGIDTIGSGVNSVRGSSFNDSLSGSSNNENFLGGYGDDTIDGRTGFDRAVYSTSVDDIATGGITVNLAAGTVDGDASIGHDTLRSIEGITGSDFADTYVATNFGATGFLDPSTNNVGNNGTFNEFEGGGGNDTITGNGNTRIAFYNALAGVTVDLGTGTSHGTVAGDVAGVGSDTFTGVTAVAGSAFNDNITGSNNAANTTEEFAGRAGDDHIDGLGGFDRAFYNGDNAAVSGIHVDMALGAVTGDLAIGADTLRSVEAIRGTNFADSYDASNFGAAGFLNTTTDNVGNFGTFNEFEGIGGNDTITGNGNTRIAFYSALDGVTVDLNSGVSHGTAVGDVAGVGNDTFTGVNAVRGSASADVIFGDAGSNTLDGQGGNDLIEGRGGADTLFGGLGADRFVFAAVADSTIASHDTISDFVQGTDVIDTSAIAGITSVQGLISGATQVAAHSIVWIQSGANTIVYANNSAVAESQGSADMEIILTAVTATTLTSLDFFFHI